MLWKKMSKIQDSVRRPTPQMAEYRAFIVGIDGRFLRAIEIACPDDDTCKEVTPGNSSMGTTSSFGRATPNHPQNTNEGLGDGTNPKKNNPPSGRPTELALPPGRRARAPHRPPPARSDP